MNQMKRLLALFVFGCLISTTFGAYQPAQGHRIEPDDVYHRAWQLVKDNYYEPGYNGVNWKELEHKFDSKINNLEDAHKYIKVMLKSLNDPYTRFLDVRSFQDENDAIDAKIVGIGINLQQTKDKAKLLITRTIEDGPAERAGVRAGDEIVAIDSSNAVGITPEQAAEKIRGQAGTPVQLTVRREKDSDSKKISIVRSEIVIKAVSTKMLDNNIGYIQLTTFISNDAAREFKQALRKYSRADGLVVDLRDNPGGLLSNALEIADMLLEGGPIVSTISRHGKHTDLASGTPVTHQPIVVLIDEESASASEILASALKDNKRAKIVGNKSYGKGLVQEINKLPGGAAVHITVSRYLTPNGTDINKVGVKPDLQVQEKEEQLKLALDTLKGEIASTKNPVRTTNLSYSH
ncbi:MAG: S41 family peptidase [Candidatus Melainabacteria bacterium]|nr:S41 family peptidase [Candidatus Melainabacteria bacterium]